MVLRNVLDVLVPLLWGLLAIGVVWYFWVTRRHYGWLTALRHLVSYRLLWPLLGVVSVSVLSASLVFIDPREVGVIISLFREGGVRENPQRAGLHWIVPLAEEVVRYPIITQSYTMSGRPYEGAELGDDAIQARTADGQLVIIDITVLFRIHPEMAVKLHIAWQDRYVRDFIRPGLRAFVRSQAARFNVDEINSEKRRAFEQALNDLNKEHSEGTGIDPIAVLVRNITFSPEYALSVEQKMTAKQRVKEAEYQAQQLANLAKGEGEQVKIKARAEAEAIMAVAKAEATARVVKAEADAEALNMIGKAIDQRDNLLTYRYIEKLSPNIKAMLLPSNAPLILPMPQLEQQPVAEHQPARPPQAQPIQQSVDPRLAQEAPVAAQH